MRSYPSASASRFDPGSTGYEYDLYGNVSDEEATALLNRALELDPANGDALHTYVGYLVAKKDWSAAMNKAELAQKCGVRIHPELLRILNEHTQDTK